MKGTIHLCLPCTRIGQFSHLKTVINNLMTSVKHKNVYGVCQPSTLPNPHIKEITEILKLANTNEEVYIHANDNGGFFVRLEHDNTPEEGVIKGNLFVRNVTVSPCFHKDDPEVTSRRENMKRKRPSTDLR